VLSIVIDMRSDGIGRGAVGSGRVWWGGVRFGRVGFLSHINEYKQRSEQVREHNVMDNHSEIKEGYKVCRVVDGNKLVSATFCAAGGQVSYHVDTWTYPLVGCGPLTVFDSWDNAKNFQERVPKNIERIYNVSMVVKGFSFLVIRRCSYILSLENKIWIQSMLFHYDQLYNRDIYTREVLVNDLPPSTVLDNQLYNRDIYIREVLANDLPHGTILADRVKLHRLDKREV